MFTIRPWLLVGKYAETQDLTLLQSTGIGAMLQLAEDAPQAGILSLYLSVEDEAPIPVASLKSGLAFVREQKSLGRTVLIACGAGISRSATFAVATLKEEEGLDLLEAYREVKARHPMALPHPELWKSLCAYYGEPVPYLQVMRMPPA
jgi:predicted protein tyrosine phosphatase